MQLYFVTPLIFRQPMKGNFYACEPPSTITIAAAPAVTTFGIADIVPIAMKCRHTKLSTIYTSPQPPDWVYPITTH